MLISTILRDAGFEVIYLGNQTPEELVAAVIEEYVDVIGLSILTSGYQPHIEKTLELLKQKEMTHVLFFVGGIILPDDIPWLEEIGVDEVFLPGTELNQIVGRIKAHVEKRASS